MRIEIGEQLAHVTRATIIFSTFCRYDRKGVTDNAKRSIPIGWLLATIGVRVRVVDNVGASDGIRSNLAEIIAPIHTGHQHKVLCARAMNSINECLHTNALIGKCLRTHAVAYPGGIVSDGTWSSPT